MNLKDSKKEVKNMANGERCGACRFCDINCYCTYHEVKVKAHSSACDDFQER